MRGKQKCRILKEIRQRIADENDIPYVTRECSFQGECRGTCPRCESELRYLEQQLARRAALGKRVSVAALCAGIALAGTGCSAPVLPGSKPAQNDLAGAVDTADPASDPDIFVTTGEVPFEDESGSSMSEPETCESADEPGWSGPDGTDSLSSVPEPIVLEGEVAYFPEESTP